MKHFFILLLATFATWAGTAHAGQIIKPETPLTGGSVRGLSDFLPTGNHGSYSQQFPLEVSPGRNGVAPNLALQYESSSGNGIVGLGWVLQGVDFIEYDHRSSPAWHLPMEERKFVSNNWGELVHIGGGYFRPLKASSFQLFLLVNHSYWIQWDSNGNRKIFGSTPDSRIESTSHQIVKWGIHAELDSTCINEATLQCNKIKYEYESDSNINSGETSPIYLKSIFYNFVHNNPITRIDFNYLTDRPDYILSLHEGFPIRTKRLLSEINVRFRSETIFRYSLNFSSPLIPGPFSLLRNLQKWGRRETRFPSHSFSYVESVSPQQWVVRPLPNFPAPNPGSEWGQSSVMIQDLDGDALPDVYSQENLRAQLFKNTTRPHSNISFSSSPTSFATQNLGDLRNSDQFWADVNGDGLMDRIVLMDGLQVLFNEGGHLSHPVTLSHSGIHASMIGSALRLIDINGDGLIDFLYRDGVSDRCFLNTGRTGWSTTPLTHVQSGLPFFVSATNRNVRVGDYNGDGLKDFIVLDEGSLSIWLNQGDCTWRQAPAPHLPEDFFSIARLHGQIPSMQLADVDGDGYDDLIGWGNNQIWSYRNLGGTGFELNLRYHPGHNQNIFYVNVLDLNGDGQADILFCDQISGNCATLQVPDHNPKPSLLNLIQGEQGDKIEIQYRPSTSFYDNRWHHKVPFVLQVPSEIKSYDGIHEPLTINFDYKDLHWDSFARKVVGFREVVANRQAGVFAGMTTTPLVTIRRIFDLGLRSEENDIAAITRAGDLLREESGAFIHEFERDYRADTNNQVHLEKVLERHSTIDGAPNILSRMIRTDFDQRIRPTAITEYPSQLSTTLSPLSESIPQSNFRTTLLSYINTIENNRPLAIEDRIQSLQQSKTVLNHSNTLVSRTSASYRDLELGTIQSESSYLSSSQEIQRTYFYDQYFQKNISQIVDDAGAPFETTFYDDAGLFPSIVMNGSNEPYTYLFDTSTGLLLSETDPNGVSTNYSYDGRGRVLEKAVRKGLQLAASSRWEYQNGRAHYPAVIDAFEAIDLNSEPKVTRTFQSANGIFLQSKLRLPGNSYRILASKDYDNVGNLTQELLIPMASPNFEYSPLGPDSPTKLSTYDASQRLSRITYPLEQTQEWLEHSIRALPSQEPAQLTSHYDRHSSHNRTDIVTDSFGRLRAVQHLQDQSTPIASYYYDYDAADALTGMTLADGSRRSVVRNGVGGVQSISDPAFGTVTNTYDHRGRLTEQVRNQSRRLRISYDLSNRKLREEYSDLTNQLASYNTAFVYGTNSNSNSIGRLASVTYPYGEDRFEYSPTGMQTLLSRNFHIEGREYGPYLIQKSYNLMYQNTLSHIDGELIRLNYDNAGQLISIPGIINSVSYNSLGSVETALFSNGVNVNYSLDRTNGNLNRIEYSRNQSPLLSENYRYDLAGNLLERSRTSSDSPTGNQQHFVYSDRDPRYRLKSYQDSARGPEEFTPINARYDSFGDLAATAPAPRQIQFDIRSLPHIIEIENTNASRSRIEYLYDYEKRKIARLKNGNLADLYISDELSAKGALAAEKTITAFAWGRPLASWQQNSSQKTFYHSDQLGSTVLTTSSQGLPQKTYVYHPHGEIISETGAGDLESSPLLFAGHRFDRETDLYEMGVRHYDLRSRAFASADPSLMRSPEAFLGDPLQLDSHLYCRGNPLSFVDHSGEFAVLPAIAVGFIGAKVIAFGTAYTLGRFSIWAADKATQQDSKPHVDQLNSGMNMALAINEPQIKLASSFIPSSDLALGAAKVFFGKDLLSIRVPSEKIPFFGNANTADGVKDLALGLASEKFKIAGRLFEKSASTLDNIHEIKRGMEIGSDIIEWHNRAHGAIEQGQAFQKILNNVPNDQGGFR